MKEARPGPASLPCGRCRLSIRGTHYVLAVKQADYSEEAIILCRTCFEEFYSFVQELGGDWSDSFHHVPRERVSAYALAGGAPA